MKIRASVSITPLPTHEVAVDLKKVPLVGGTGTFTIEEDERVSLFWRVRGTPLTKYTIKVEPEEGRLVMDGTHPIATAIAKGVTAGGGHRFFTLTKKAGV